MKILNIGSLNLDYVYQVPHMVQPGETLAANGRNVFCGGKGLNQSIALAKAGAEVCHAGLIGEEGDVLRQALVDAGVDCRYVKTIPCSTGHAIIQVDGEGQNCILLYGGANRSLTSAYIDDVLSGFCPGEMLLLQNEVNKLDEIVNKGWERGMKIVLNPSPFDDALKAVDLNKVSMLILNEVEGEQMTGERVPEAILGKLKQLCPQTEIVLTLGSEGACFQQGETLIRQPAYMVDVVDTTAAGDTFTGYFLAGLTEELTAEACLDLAQKAASIAVSRSGAAPSIPTRNEIK